MGTKQAADDCHDYEVLATKWEIRGPEAEQVKQTCLEEWKGMGVCECTEFSLCISILRTPLFKVNNNVSQTK